MDKQQVIFLTKRKEDLKGNLFSDFKPQSYTLIPESGPRVDGRAVKSLLKRTDEKKKKNSQYLEQLVINQNSINKRLVD